MEVGMVARPRAASVPSRLELLDGSCWERQHTQQVAPQLADASLAQLVSLSSTVGPRDSFGAPAAHRANSLPAPCLPAPSPKRQASPGAPSAPLAKKASGARAWSPYHAYCQAEHVEGGLVMRCRLTSLACWTWPSGTWLLRAGRSVDSAASDTPGQEQRPLLAATLRNADRETLLGQQWKALSQDDKAKYSVGEAAYYIFCREQRPRLPAGLSHVETQRLLG